MHLAPVAALALPETLAQWKQYTQLHSKSLFHLLQATAADLRASGQGRVLAAAMMGGYWGRTEAPMPGLPTGGGSNGMLKTMNIEWPEVAAKTVDFDQSLSAEMMADCIAQELLTPDSRIEIGYPQGQRTVFDPIPADLKAQSPIQLQPASDWVTLVTGGARGVTAEVSRIFLVPGATLILVGRSAEPPVELADTAGITDIGSLRKAFLLRAKSQGLIPKPAEIERQVQGLLRDRTIRANLTEFRQAGVTVEYHGVDVKDEPTFTALIQDIYQRHGRLDAVVHGAGIIEDKLIVDKNPDSFNRVFDTKVDSIFLLSRLVRTESLKLFAVFGSVAGSFGNRGQVDYATANETMNRVGWYLDKLWPQVRVLTINWGPWAAGMASDAVNEQFKARGVIPIPPLSGRRFFRDDLYYGQMGEAELIAGTFEGSSREAYEVQRHLASAKAEAEVVPPATPVQSNGNGYSNGVKPNYLPLLRNQPKIQPNSSITLEHKFAYTSDPYLEDHAFDGNFVVPATMNLEVMAQFVQAAWPEWKVAEIQDMRVLKGISFPPDTSHYVLVRGRAASHADAASLEISVEIVDPDTKIPHYRAKVVMRPELETAPFTEYTPLTSGEPEDAKLAYPRYLFHGRRLELITQLPRVSEEGVDAMLIPSTISEWLPNVKDNPVWLFDPGILDAAMQISQVRLRKLYNISGLPSRLGSVIRYSEQLPKQPLQASLRVKSFDGTHIVTHTDISDETGRVYLRLLDTEATCSEALNRLNIRWRIEHGYPEQM